MARIEEYWERADQLAEEIVNAWRMNVRAGNASLLTEEFMRVFDRACRYRNAKVVADNQRQFGALNERAEAEEDCLRVEFAAAYKEFSESFNKQRRELRM